MNLLLSFLSAFGRRRPPEPTAKQNGTMARAIRLLVAHGSIDAWTITQLGTTDCHKMLTRMRRLGLLYAAEDARGFRWVTNPKTGARFKRHYWTRKQPKWAPVKERRAKPRGGCV